MIKIKYEDSDVSGVTVKKLKTGPKRIINWSVDNETDCWNCISHKPDADGYPRIGIDRKTKKISRVMYENHKGLIPSGMLIRHTCDNRRCINPDHLIIGTIQENNQDTRQRNRYYLKKRGVGAQYYFPSRKRKPKERVGPKPKRLSKDEVLFIRNSSIIRKELAVRFNVSYKTIRFIQLGKCHKNI